MSSNTSIVVAGLSFDTIRANLRDYLKTKPDFVDFDFEDSAIGTLLDLLAYNTYYNAFYANMATNEGFLDSAQLYDSVVSHAKTLGYTPTSAKGASANVRIRFTEPATSSERSLTIAKDSQFTSTINGVSYIFVTPKSYTIAANSTNGLQGYIKLVEGTPLTHRFIFTTANTSFVLPNANTESQCITITASIGGNVQTFLSGSAVDVSTVNSSAKVYYLEADRDQLYKISFGDNVFGIRPDYNSTVTVNYRVCNGIRGNGANNFSGPGSLGGRSNYTISVAERATGGAGPEDIESIRFKAPRFFETQNRAVTKSDYSNIILTLNPDLSGANVWGGEENVPPIYGKVYAAVKPIYGTLISTNRKNSIISQMKEYNVQSIDMEIVDPTYLYVVPTVTVRYNPKDTILTASQVADAVANRIISFEASTLNLFEKKFRFSRFLNYISLADQSVLDARATIDLQKRFAPSTIISTNYSLPFNQQLQKLGELEQISTDRAGSARHPGFGFLSSTRFTYSDVFHSHFDDNGFGVVRVYYKNDSLGRFGRVYTNFNAGIIDYDTGLLSLTGFQPNEYDGEIKINVRPVGENVGPIRNQILLIADATIKVVNDNTNNVDATVTNVNTIGSTTSLSSVTSAVETITTF